MKTADPAGEYEDTDHTYKNTDIEEQKTDAVSGVGNEDWKVFGVRPLSAASQTSAPARAARRYGLGWGTRVYRSVRTLGVGERGGGSSVGFVCLGSSQHLGWG